MNLLRHYEVFSPQMTFGGSYEPPEVGCCWVMVLARSKRDALIQAVRHPDFKDWVREARGDRVPPFKGLTARLCQCEHGHCWGCDGEDCMACLWACEQASAQAMS